MKDSIILDVTHPRHLVELGSGAGPKIRLLLGLALSRGYGDPEGIFALAVLRQSDP